MATANQFNHLSLPVLRIVGLMEYHVPATQDTIKSGLGFVGNVLMVLSGMVSGVVNGNSVIVGSLSVHTTNMSACLLGSYADPMHNGTVPHAAAWLAST